MVTKKTLGKKAPVKKKVAVKKAPAKKKVAVKKAPAKKKVALKKSPAKKVVAKISSAKKKVIAKKAPAEKLVIVAKKLPTKKAEIKIAPIQGQQVGQKKLKENNFLNLKIAKSKHEDPLTHIPDSAPANDEVSHGPLRPIVKQGPKVGRNEPCPCGSGMKYKKCCGKK